MKGTWRGALPVCPIARPCMSWGDQCMSSGKVGQRDDAEAQVGRASALRNENCRKEIPTRMLFLKNLEYVEHGTEIASFAAAVSTSTAGLCGERIPHPIRKTTLPNASPFSRRS